MIIYIDETIGQHCINKPLTEEESLMFSDLVTAHQHGKCLLCGALNTLEQLEKSLGNLHGKLYRQIYNKYSEMKSIIDFVETLLVISYDECPVVPTFIETKYKLLKVDEAITYKLNEECTLVGENLNDCAFYELLANRYIHSKRIVGSNFTFHKELGGGDTITSVFKKCVEHDKAPTLCLVDSDIKHGPTKSYPNPPAKGNTANNLIKAFQKLSETSQPSLYELYCLPVHEVENLIPLSVLSEIADMEVKEMQKGVNCLNSLLNIYGGAPILYYDFKNGYRHRNNEPYLCYWSEIAAISGNTSFPRLCEKVLDKALNILQNDDNNPNSIINVIIDEYLVELWNTIGLKVFSWGCANEPIRA